VIPNIRVKLKMDMHGVSDVSSPPNTACTKENSLVVSQMVSVASLINTPTTTKESLSKKMIPLWATVLVLYTLKDKQSKEHFQWDILK